MIGTGGTPVRDDRRQCDRGGRAQEYLPGGDRDRSGTGSGQFYSSVGRKISDDLEDVARQVDRHHHVIRLPARNSPSDLHHECHRIG